MTLTLRCCGKSITIEGDAEKVQKIADMCSTLGATKPDSDSFDIPEIFGEYAIDVFQYFWARINQQ